MFDELSKISKVPNALLVTKKGNSLLPSVTNDAIGMPFRASAAWPSITDVRDANCSSTLSVV